MATDDRATRAKEILGLRRLPIKVGFLDAPPPALARWSGGPVAAGCVFWDRAMDGKSFYTLPADHWNCAIGSHTHKIGLPADRANELPATIGFMVETRYLDAAEVPGIPTLDRAPAAVAYAPAASDAFKADVVLLALTPAAVDAGVRGGAEGRHRAGHRRSLQPPELRDPAGVRQTELVSISFGCRGNRTFTTVGDDEMYVAIPGARWDDFVDRLIEVQRSNLTMGNYYQAQAAKFAASK